MLTFGSLFAGIGGFDLGFERAGLQCKWQVEIDPFCQKVLAKHWPHVRRHDDVRTFPPTDPDEWRVDVVCGGFPCQDISLAGKGAGIEGERSGLWSEYIRIVRLLRPRFVVVENVAAILVRGIDRVLGDLAASGFDAEWQGLPASAFGAPHIRDRVFIVAYARSERLEGEIFARDRSQATGGFDARRATAGTSLPIAAANAELMQGRERCHVNGERRREIKAEQARMGVGQISGFNGGWNGESPLLRMDDGPADWMDRLRACGNAVVPTIAEHIARQLTSPLRGTHEH